ELAQAPSAVRLTLPAVRERVPGWRHQAHRSDRHERVLLVPRLPGHLLRRPRLPAHGVATPTAGARRGGGTVTSTDPTRPARALTRRRAVTITATAGLSLLCAADRATRSAPLYHWTGSSLGSPSRLALCHPDRVAAGRLVGRCVAEIVRLERI